MDKKSSKHSITYNPKIKNTYLKLNDIAVALNYGQLNNDQRIQVKMPKFIVEELARIFPHIDRSKLLTKLAVQALLDHYRYLDQQEILLHQLQEQEDLDEMWSYLEKRDHQ